jgi:hypothetical protein
MLPLFLFLWQAVGVRCFDVLKLGDGYHVHHEVSNPAYAEEKESPLITRKKKV